jgi:uncharacterized protein Yka (UPF0111/DUF47 family)
MYFISTIPSSITQHCSARLTLWKAPPSCLAQQYQKYIDHFERDVKVLVSQAQQYQKYIDHFERDVKAQVYRPGSQSVGAFK